jgi:hypothetical protein
VSLGNAYAILVASVVCEVPRHLGAAREPAVLPATSGAARGRLLRERARRHLAHLPGDPHGVVYGLWSGLGIVLIAGSGWLVFGQRLDLPATFGLALILAGVLVINFCSRSLSH